MADAAPPRKSAALLVATGIFLSRISGFVRESLTARIFGVGAHADVLSIGFRGANLLQNLLGEGTISAAFIPIYSRLLAEGRAEDAGRFAGALFGLLLAAVTLFAGLGWLCAPWLALFLAPGFALDAARVAAGEIAVDRLALTVTVLRLAFPMVAVLVLSAWALGVLNSHRRFLLAYLAPVLWNAAIIGALLWGLWVWRGDGAAALDRLLAAAFWGALVGGVLQFGVQLPLVLRLLRGFRVSLSTRVEGVQASLRAFGPVVAGRGVYQVSSYLDTVLAGLLAVGALSAIRYATTLYLLPISLFGMSVSASELPELARLGASERTAFLDRLHRSLRQMLFMTLPTVVGYLAFGLLIVRVLYEGGPFDIGASLLVYAVLAGYTLGLAATTAGRLLQNAFYTLSDTKTPAKIAVVRVTVSAVVGAGLMLLLDRHPLAWGGSTLRLGALGLALGATAGAWIELALLLRALRRREVPFALPWKAAAKLTGLACAAALPAAALWAALSAMPVIVQAVAVLGSYGAAYLALAWLLRLEEAEAWFGRLMRRK